MLEDKVVIVTGGSKGLGLATCEKLVEMGAKVGVLARSQADIDAAVEKLGADNAVGASVDVSNKESVAKAFAVVKERFGKVNGLVNNAGLAKPNKVETLPTDDLMLQLNTNFVGLVYCCQAAIPFGHAFNHMLIKPALHQNAAAGRAGLTGILYTGVD